MKLVHNFSLLALITLLGTSGAQASEYYSFDGVGFPTCYNVTVVHNATSVDDSKPRTCSDRRARSPTRREY